jgi:phosphoglycerol geranylgeranyltransferase
MKQHSIYKNILTAKLNKQPLLAILIDPDKIELHKLPQIIIGINNSPATHVFVGGSLVSNNVIDSLISTLQQHIQLPIVLFPGNPSQISNKADGILFLTLLSGRNSDYLIEHQVNAVPILQKTSLEIISTGYLLIESGAITAVERVSQTKPLDRNNIAYACQTAIAGELIGNKLIYLEAGSGAKWPVPTAMITAVASAVSVPVIVGGGLRSNNDIQQAYQAGADLVVIGTAFENNTNFFTS